MTSIYTLMYKAIVQALQNPFTRLLLFIQIGISMFRICVLRVFYFFVYNIIIYSKRNSVMVSKAKLIIMWLTAYFA